MLDRLLGSRSIAQRLTLVMGLVLLIAFTGSALGVAALSRLASKSAAMYGTHLSIERDTAELYRLITNAEVRNKAIALSGDTTLGGQFATEAGAATKKSVELLKSLEGRLTLPDEKRAFEQLSASRQAFLDARDALGAAKTAGDEAKVKDIYANRFQPAVARLSEASLAIARSQRDALDGLATDLDQTNQAARTALISFSAVAIALAVWLAVVLTRSITRPVRSAAEVAAAITRFDLTQPVPRGSSDEVGQLMCRLHDMQGELQKLVGQLCSVADNVGTASAEIAVGNQDLSHRTEETASNLQMTASAVAELTGTVKQTADAAMTANQLAGSAAEVARRGGTVVSQVVTTMDEISQSSRRINDIIGTIDGIAFQTNILALNAAVEAARAGEQGRGFAVVAGEVRLLAQRSAEAAKEIKSLITASVERVDSGTHQVQAAGSTMTEIVASVQRVTDIIGEISAAAREQSEGIGVVNGSVLQLDQMTQQNAALVEEAASAAESLKEQSSRLAAAISVFRLHGTAAASPTPAPRPVTAARPAAQAVAKPAAQATAKRAAPAAKPTRAPAPAATPRPAARATPAASAPAPAPRSAPAPKPAEPVSEGDWETF